MARSKRPQISSYLNYPPKKEESLRVLRGLGIVSAVILSVYLGNTRGWSSQHGGSECSKGKSVQSFSSESIYSTFIFFVWISLFFKVLVKQAYSHFVFDWNKHELCNQLCHFPTTCEKWTRKIRENLFSSIGTFVQPLKLCWQKL